ncbi:MAG: DUF2914 domain-containing protein [Syntrophales bacterium]
MDRLKGVRAFAKRFSNVVFFVGGFLFDAYTLIRIDSIIDLVLQSLYLIGITLIIIGHAHLEAGRWQPKGWIARLWLFESEIIHFLYGGLLSAYVILYFKSTSMSRSLIFLVLVCILMIANEMPQVRRWKSSLRLGLYAFCLISYLNYLFPVLIGRMGDWVFTVAWMLSVGLTYAFIKKLAGLHPEPRKARVRLGWSPVLVLVVVAVLYFIKWIPPVPLSMQYAGIFRSVEPQPGGYRVTYLRPPWTRFWQESEQVFLAREQDRVYFFTRIFGPSRFEHRVFLRWEFKDPRRKRWITSDRIPLPIKGGRDEGYRGYTYKENYQPGEWRVEIETEDGRVLGGVAFRIEQDPSVEERIFLERRM